MRSPLPSLQTAPRTDRPLCRSPRTLHEHPCCLEDAGSLFIINDSPHGWPGPSWEAQELS